MSGIGSRQRKYKAKACVSEVHTKYDQYDQCLGRVYIRSISRMSRPNIRQTPEYPYIQVCA